MTDRLDTPYDELADDRANDRHDGRDPWAGDHDPLDGDALGVEGDDDSSPDRSARPP